MEIKDLAGLSQPLTKFIEVVARGTGILYEPIHVKRMAKAKAIEMKTISSAIQDSELPIKYDNGQLTIDTSTKDFIERTERRTLFLEAKKQKNIEDIISGTYNNLETEKEVSEEPLDEDWINRYFNIIGDVSNDDLKTIWSKILSEEIKQPGKYSLRTLECLRNISKSEAELFGKIANYIIKYRNVYYLPNEKELLESVKIYYDSILKLDEASLINSSSNVNAKLNFDENIKENYLIYNNTIIICKKEGKHEINLQAYPLTEVGKNIFDIVSPTYNKEYFEKYIDIIKNRMDISYSRIIKELPDGRIEYQTPVIDVSTKN